MAEKGSELARILAAVAALDTFAAGPCDDRCCPFDCGWEEYSREQHDDDCPITLARKVKADDRVDLSPSAKRLLGEASQQIAERDHVIARLKARLGEALDD